MERNEDPRIMIPLIKSRDEPTWKGVGIQAHNEFQEKKKSFGVYSIVSPRHANKYESLLFKSLPKVGLVGEMKWIYAACSELKSQTSHKSRLIIIYLLYILFLPQSSFLLHSLSKFISPTRRLFFSHHEVVKNMHRPSFSHLSIWKYLSILGLLLLLNTTIIALLLVQFINVTLSD